MTKEEIIKKYYYISEYDSSGGSELYISWTDAKEAMQIYADQQTAELRREVEELRKIREAYQDLTGELNKRAGII
jgi:hypothetical protein